MFSWQKRTKKKVEIGETYRRELRAKNGGKADETARVVSVSDDEVGIPHVRYHRCVGGRPQRDGSNVDDRTLALTAFLQLYPQRASA